MLGLPPTPFAPKGMDIVTLNAKDLVRISKYDSGEPYFGHNLANRFDDPSKPPTSPFRVCYCATSLQAALSTSTPYQTSDSQRLSASKNTDETDMQF